MKNLQLDSAIVSAEWLNLNIDAENLIILDASIPKVKENVCQEGNLQIPKARFFDLKNKFSQISAAFPNSLPSKEQFQNEARALGVNNDSAVIIYDDKGIYSSPRAWWLFRAFGFNNVAVLDGGLPEWIRKGFDVTQKSSHQDLKGNFIAKAESGLFCFFENIKMFTQDKKYTILDARSEGRFLGKDPEPREGLRSGHIPNSKNLPFQNLLTDSGKMKSKKELQLIFNDLILQKERIVFSCGSGITACILALGAELAGYNNLCVYDGSWAEYGTLTN